MSDFKNYLEETEEIGHIIGLNHYLAYVSGLPKLKLGEMVVTEDRKKGLVNGLDKEKAEILMFEPEKLKVGQRITRTNSFFQIPVSQEFLGRIINPLGQPIDGLGPISGEKEYLPIQREAPEITQRKRVNQFLETGITIVDLLVPMGYGQRELIIGDAKIGKTTFVLQTISNQTKKGVICIYVGMGKETSAFKTVEGYLKEMGAFDKTVMMIATAKNSSTINYLSPFAGMTVAEYFRDKGKKVLIVFDDMTSHAKFYREICLLVGRLPGRSAYPGNIFHIQASLLERAGNIKRKFLDKNLNMEEKEISITALPVAETLENDISGFIQTNLMGMTDGHIFFDINDFKKGKRPAINSSLSVSRVGNQTKKMLDKEIADWIRKKMIEYQRTEEISQFGGELSQKAQKILEFGKKLEIVFNQDSKTTIPRILQLLILGLLAYGFWENKPQNIIKVEINAILKNRQKLLQEFEQEIEKIKNLKELETFIEKIIPKIKEILYHPL